MQETGNMRQYRRQVRRALENRFLAKAMDNFAVAYRASRAKAFKGMDVDELVAEVTAIKDKALEDMERLYGLFRQQATAAGAQVHLATDADQANRIIADIAAANGVQRIIKSKSMTAEETLLNHSLEAAGLQVTETDLGEWIIQLRREGPSHMVMPAIHLSRYQVGDLFSKVTGTVQDAEDIDRLVKVARDSLRQAFFEADMGISGANFALAATGTLGLVTNEGNARLVTTLPPVHVALVGLDKLLPDLHAALTINQVLPRNATGQAITSYVTWITGPTPAGGQTTAPRQLHIVFLDNGRRKMAADPLWRQVLRCVRCGACANVCPVYRMVGGHSFGHIYIGAIGLINTFFFHGPDKARNLVQNCLNCGACKQVCAAGIDLPHLIQQVRHKITRRQSTGLPLKLLGQVMTNRKLFHGILRTAGRVQKPAVAKGPYLRHLPMFFSPRHRFRRLPPLADIPFRDLWPRIQPRLKRISIRAALFAGCLQDFVYPEQLEAGVRFLASQDVKLSFPSAQTCCGLPLAMLGQNEAALSVARKNIAAFENTSGKIITLCASCANQLKNSYPAIMAGQGRWAKRAAAFAARIVPFSVFVSDELKLKKQPPVPGAPIATYHAPCHLCRGLKISNQPRSLVEMAGFSFKPAAEEETCCGFGGTYSGKFPEISSRIANRKINDIMATGATTLLTECPGCILQLRGCMAQKGIPIKVLHFSEALEQATAERTG